MRVNIISSNDPQEIQQKASSKSLANTTPENDDLINFHFKIATFNLFNYLEPPNAYYEFERIYSAAQWAKKQKWIIDYLEEYQPDIIGFQEVFSTESLKQLVQEHGYSYFAVVDQPHVIDDFIYQPQQLDNVMQ